MKGEFTHPRTKYMLELCLQHAAAQFERNCGLRERGKCLIYGGSAWNRGTHVTVIIDRCVCAEHATRPAMADIETWIYDVSGESLKYLGKDSVPANAELLVEPGDRDDGAKKRSFLKD